jgi:hypothetical protein
VHSPIFFSFGVPLTRIWRFCVYSPVSTHLVPITPTPVVHFIISHQPPPPPTIPRTSDPLQIYPLKTPKHISFQFSCSVDTVYLIICNNLLANDTIILTNDTRSHTKRKFIIISYNFFYMMIQSEFVSAELLISTIKSFSYKIN